jgi:hypothetical protein
MRKYEIEELKWFDLVREYSKRHPDKYCVFLETANLSFDQEERLKKCVGLRYFFSYCILLLFSSDKAVDWVNRHHEEKLGAYAVCIRDGEILAENT